MFKRCSSCKQVRSVDNFHKDKRIADGYRAICKKCAKRYQEIYYETHSPEILLRASARKIEKSMVIRKLKSVPCKDCGVTYPRYIMDFDHLYDKKFNISAALGMSLPKILEEIKKCDVICSNCHRFRTYRRKNIEEIL